MKIQFENDTLNTALSDLRRPHAFAFERVGYFLGDIVDDYFIARDWLSFSDDLYEKTDDVGARIGSNGMKKLMTAALKTNKSFLQ